MRANPMPLSYAELNDLLWQEGTYPVWCDERNGDKFEYSREAYVDDITEDEINLGTKAIREIRYRVEADPLFFKVQRGEIDNQIWLDKVAEIKAIAQEVKAKYPKELV